MDGMLSQEEINALLGNMNTGSSSTQTSNDAILSDEEKDAIGEISNICMGTAATTLYSLVNQKVVITTPVVEITNWDKLTAEYAKPCVFINILYKDGIDGNNVLILKEDDVKVITDLMMGGDGSNTDGELSELHLSAISEAMNQMMGSAATSLSSMLEKKVDISPPSASLVDLNDTIDDDKIVSFLDDEIVQISFDMKIGDLVDSQIMQLYPFDFARDLYQKFMGNTEASADKAAAEANPAGITKVNVLACCLLGGLFAVLSIVAYVGGVSLAEPLKQLSENASWLMGGFSVAGGMMRYVGFAVLLKIMLANDMWGIYFAGFAFAALFGNIEATVGATLVLVAFIGIAIAMYDYNTSIKIGQGGDSDGI